MSRDTDKRGREGERERVTWDGGKGGRGGHGEEMKGGLRERSRQVRMNTDVEETVLEDEKSWRVLKGGVGVEELENCWRANFPVKRRGEEEEENEELKVKEERGRIRSKKTR